MTTISLKQLFDPNTDLTIFLNTPLYFSITKCPDKAKDKCQLCNSFFYLSQLTASYKMFTLSCNKYCSPIPIYKILIDTIAQDFYITTTTCILI